MPKPSVEQENKILGVMMQYLMRGTETVSLEKISKDLDFHIRSKSWVASWKSLVNDHNFVEPATSGAAMATGQHRLTEKGKEHASTPEYEQYVKDMNFVPATNEDHQKRITDRLMNDHGRSIFDLLLKHGSLDRHVMAAILKTRSGSHKFSYALKELKDKNFVDVDQNAASSKCKKLRLTDKSFLNPETDRPEPIEVDQQVLDEAMVFAGTKKKRNQSQISEDGEQITKKKKTSSCVSTAGDDDAEDTKES